MATNESRPGALRVLEGVPIQGSVVLKPFCPTLAQEHIPQGSGVEGEHGAASPSPGFL